MAKASDNPFPSILLVEQASAPATPASGQARLYRGTDNKHYVIDDTGASVELGAGGGAVATAKATRTAGDITFTADAAPHAFDTGGSLDVTIAAAAGDVVELIPNMLFMAQTGGSAATIKVYAATRVGGADVNKVQGNAAAGVMGWFVPAGLYTIGAPFQYTVQAGDVSGGTVTFRLYYNQDNGGAGSARGVFASATNPAIFQVKNLKH